MLSIESVAFLLFLRSDCSTLFCLCSLLSIFNTFGLLPSYLFICLLLLFVQGSSCFKLLYCCKEPG
jgi:hypothetical protein